VDTLITVAIVSAAAAWAGYRLWRRATAKASSCTGGCAGCPGARGVRTTALPCPESADASFPRAGTDTGIPLPSRFDRKG
jgi:hypothetical protein